MICKLLGRGAGWIALDLGLQVCRSYIIARIPLCYNKIADKLRKREAEGKRFSIVVVAEGAKQRRGSCSC
jgi:6-phosphofructokinase 1